MTVHAAAGACDGFDLEVGDGVVDDVEVSLEVSVADLLEEDRQFVLDLLDFVEEVKLVSLHWWQDAVD